MTSEPDGNPGRRPPTIELKATEVEADKLASDAAATEPAARRGEEAPDPQSPGPPGDEILRSRLKPHAVSALVGAVVMAVIVAGLWFAGLLPWRDTATAPNSATPPSPPHRKRRMAQIFRRGSTKSSGRSRRNGRSRRPAIDWRRRKLPQNRSPICSPR